MSTPSFLDDLFSSFLADRRSNGLFFRLSTGIGVATAAPVDALWSRGRPFERWSYRNLKRGARKSTKPGRSEGEPGGVERHRPKGAAFGAVCASRPHHARAPNQEIAGRSRARRGCGRAAPVLFPFAGVFATRRRQGQAKEGGSLAVRITLIHSPRTGSPEKRRVRGTAGPRRVRVGSGDLRR